MPRLVTFGCSMTYGHGLPDCHRDPNWPGPYPSKFAWPQLLADKLGYECCNLSRPGAGNFEILIKLLKTDFMKDDLVIIAWSFFNRYHNYKIIDLELNGRVVIFDSNEYKSILVNQMETENFNETNHVYNWLTHQHAELFLNSKNIKNFSVNSLHKGDESKINPKYIHLENFLDDVHSIYVDKALDNSHPGTESHKLRAELIYNKIIDRIK